MKRWIAFFFITVLLLSFAAAAQADTYYVYTQNGKTLNLRSPVDNSVIGNIPYGTKLETDDSLSTETAAYVTYGGKSGYVKWEFLVKDPPPARNKNTAGKATTPPGATPAPSQQVTLPTDGEGDVTIQVIGGSVRYADGNAEYSAVSYNTPRKLVITADAKPEYWVIDGVRYDFEPYVPTSFTLDSAENNMVIEAVPRGSGSRTLLSKDDIQAIRTGEQLLVKTIHAQLCHLTAKDYGKGGWMKEFDFTNDYKNRATEKMEQGGQVTIRTRAIIPDGKRISYWLFDEAKLDFDTDVTQFIVRTLNTSKTYEPVFGNKSATVTTPPTSRAPATRYYQVTCHGCSFTGGGYTNATSGSVPAGTQITVTNRTNSSLVEYWQINGSILTTTIIHEVDGQVRVRVKTNTITRTINKDTDIVCAGVIN